MSSFGKSNFFIEFDGLFFRTCPVLLFISFVFVRFETCIISTEFDKPPFSSLINDRLFCSKV